VVNRLSDFIWISLSGIWCRLFRVLLIIVFFVLVSGPNAKWVKRFLPDTANRVLFTAAMSALLLGWFVMGVVSIVQGRAGEGLFSIALSVACAAALYPFIAAWWLRPKKDTVPLSVDNVEVSPNDTVSTP